MSNEKNIKSNQFPKEEKKIRYKHDFKVKDGCLYFNFLVILNILLVLNFSIG